jgi:8-oxo-dGTP diphosphatase
MSATAITDFEAIDWDSWEARDRATLLFVVLDFRVLLIRKLRGLGAGKINAPGGRIDPGETSEGEAVETEEAVPLWTPVDAIPYDEMWADDRIWVPLLLAGKRFSGRFLFDDDVMLGYTLSEE